MNHNAWLSQLEGYRDWQGLVEELERALVSAADDRTKADLHLHVGRVLNHRLLQGVKALKHFQDAYKRNSSLTEALTEARGVYWTLGKLNMVQKLLELELKARTGAQEKARLYLELAHVVADHGQVERSQELYAKALTCSEGSLDAARDGLEDAQVTDSTWQHQISNLLQRVPNALSNSEAALTLLRASRIAKRFALTEVEELLSRAYLADPTNLEVAALYEELLITAGRVDDISLLQIRMFEGRTSSDIAKIALACGVRWFLRHQNIEQAAKLLERSFIEEPSDAAFSFLKEVYGSREGNWEKVIGLIEHARQRGTAELSVFFASQLVDIFVNKLSNHERAQQAVTDLISIAPDHPILESLKNGDKFDFKTTSSRPLESPSNRAIASASASPIDLPAASESELGPDGIEHTVSGATGISPSQTNGDSLSHPPVVDEEQIKELRVVAAKQEAAKRYNEYVKTLVQLGNLVADSQERIELLQRAAELYVSKFANQTEAVKVYEQILELDPDHGESAEFLRQAYEKRRDWEKLLGLQRREAERLPVSAERNQRFLEMARLASERIKKPEVNVELWRTVLDDDPESIEALGNLGALYERLKDFSSLVKILEVQANLTGDTAQKIQLLSKVGTFYGDRLNDDEGAVRAWRNLLALDPNERRAQEALKKKYLALGRWDDLKVFYEESGKWDEFIRVLEAQEAKETLADAKIGLLIKIAQLWADKKQKVDRAAKSYEKVLELDPHHLEAAEALMPIYGHTNNTKGLATAIEVKLIHEKNNDVRLELLREVAGIYEQKLRDPQSSFERYLAAFSLEPNDIACREDVERLARVTERWVDVIDAYRNVIGLADRQRNEDLSISLKLRLGHILVEHVGQVDQALTEFRSVYEVDGNNQEAIVALEQLYRQTSRFNDLLTIYERKRDLSATWSEKQEILYSIAKLYEHPLEDPFRAVLTYRQVLDEAPEDTIALAALDSLYRQLEQWDFYVDVLRRRIDLETDSGVLIDLKYRLGQTLEQHQDDSAAALQSYREILLLDQAHEGARLALESLLSHSRLGAEAAGILEPIYELREDWERLIEVVEILGTAERDTERRVFLLRKVARIASTHLHDVERALDASARALKDDPSSQDTRHELEQYAEQAQAWDKLESVFQHVADGLEDTHLARDYWMRMAQIDERLNKIDRAAAEYERVLGLDPADTEALTAMDTLYRRTERWADLIHVYRRRIELTLEPVERESLFGQMATVYADKLKRPDQAIAAYREVLSEDETSVVALQALDVLFTESQLWADLADNLDAQLRLAESEETQVSFMLRLAGLHETKMDQAELAIEIYRQILERESSNLEALLALERLGADSRYELTVAEILEPLYRQTGSFAKLIGVYEIQVRRSDEPVRKVELLHQIAQLYEDGAGDLQAAFETYARALRIDPAHEDTQVGIDRLARATSRFQDLAVVYRELAGEQQELAVACSLYTASARIYENDLNSIENAVGLYRQVLSIEPTSLDAAISLERLFQQSEQYPELSLILQRKSEILDDVEERKAALFQAASIEQEVLENRESAIGVYLKILDIDNEDVRAIDALIELYLDVARWEELLSTYQRKVDLLSDAEEKKAIYYQIGAVFERELGDVGRAIDTYQCVIEIDPDDLVALGRLDVLYQTAKNWSELLAVLQREAEMTDDSEEAVSFNYRIAELYEKHIKDVVRAVELYREILLQQPEHAPTLAALEHIKLGHDEPLAAALVLEQIYESHSDWPNLISVLEVQVQHADDSFKKVELLHRVARLYEDALGDLQSSFSTYARAVPIDNGNEETLQYLERLAVAVSRWPDVANLYDEQLNSLKSEPERYIELCLRLAQIYEIQLEDLDAAVSRYRQVLEVDGENQPAVQALDRLFSHMGRWRDLAAILSREAEIAQSPEEIFEFRYRLGQLQQSQLGDVDVAIEAYRDILSSAPEHELALRALEELFTEEVRQVAIAEILEPIYEAAGEWEKLAGVYEAQLRSITEPSERLSGYYRLGELFEERILNTAAALEIYIRALREEPLDERSGLDVERLAAIDQGGWENLANVYADITGEHPDPFVKTTIGKRLARVFEEELMDVENAEQTYRYVLSVEPLESDALAQLDRICLALEKWLDLASVLEQRVRVPQQESLDLVDLYARLGEVYEERLQRFDDAIRAYTRILQDLDRVHEPSIMALARLYTEKEAWGELLGVFERELEIAVGDTQESEIRAKMAYLLSDKLGDFARSIATWKQVLELRGEDQESLGALANLYEREQLWAELTEILDRHESIADSDEARVHALTRRAQTFRDYLGRDEEALVDWNRVLDIDYANLDALRAIAEIRRKEGDAHELVNILHQTVERASPVLSVDELKTLFRELGKTYGNILGQPFDAADAWTRLLEVDPTDFEAMDALESIYSQEERWQDVVNVKMGRAAALTDTSERIREYLEVASIWEHKLEDRDGGRVAFESILQIEPTHDQAFSVLEYLHTQAERWEPLIELYLNRLETRHEVAERNDLLRRIAHVFELNLQDPAQSFDALLTAFANDYSDDKTVAYLEKMAQMTNRWAELIENANQWLQQETDTQQRIALSLRLAKWYGEDLGHPEYAQPYFAQVIQLDPNNVAVMRQMGSLYRKNGQWQMLGEILTKALEVAVTDKDRKETLTELGDIVFQQLRNVDQALSFYLRALDVDRHFVPAIESLEKIYTEREQYEDLVKILGQKVAGLQDPARIAATKLRMGGLYETSLVRPEDAARLYREALDVDSSSLEALRGLERVYQSLQRWGELVTVLETQLEIVNTERERIDILYKLAVVQEEQFLKFDIQAARLEQILEIDPNHLPALEGLQRAYRRLRQWHDLINAYERHVHAANDRVVKVGLYEKVATTYADELQDLDRAIDAYRNIVDIDDTYIPALEALSKLYDKQGDGAQAIESMTRVADLTTDGKQRVEMYFRIGKALDEKLGDRVQAQERYETALDLDPTHLPSLTALRQIAVDSADWDRATRYLEQEQLHTQAPRQRARILVELGKLRDEMLGEHEAAIQAYELALQSDPDIEEAAFPLMMEYAQQERWSDAEPLADLLVRKSGKRDRGEQHFLQNMLAKITAAQGKDERALRAYQAAAQLDPTDRETIRGLAEINFLLRDWAGALTNFQKVLTSLEEDDYDGRADVYYKLGCIKREQGQVKQAINNFEKALALVSSHRPTLEALVLVYAEAKDWKQVAEYKRQILDNVMDPEERFTLLLNIADLWKDQDKNPGKAIEALEEARDVKPDDHMVLHRLLQLYPMMENWPKMIDTVQTLAEIETHGERKAKYLYTLAQLYRDKENDLGKAVDLFDQALDLNPGLLEAFERINKILTSQKNWKQLERAYRKMLFRLKDRDNADLEYSLLHSLGLIYRDRMQDQVQAIEAFKLAKAKKPSEMLENQILAELYESTNQVDLAIEEQREILEKDPLRVDPYRTLYRLFQGKHAYDEAWCMSAALAFLRKADAEEASFFEDYRPRPQGTPQVKARLTNDHWARNLFHEDANIVIGKIFEMLSSSALIAKVEDLKRQNKLPALDPRFLQDPATSTVTFAKTFGWAAQVLGLSSVPQLYVRSDIGGGLVTVPNQPPAVVAGQAVLTGFSPQELTFICGKHLSQFRGEFFIKNLFPTQLELEVILYAGIKLVRSDFALPADKQAQAVPVAQALARSMQPIQLEGLRQAVKVFFEQGAKVNLKRWLQGANATAARAGLLLCGDLEIAKKIISAEPQLPGDLSPAEKMKDLLVFSVSADYFTLRKALGIAIG